MIDLLIATTLAAAEPQITPRLVPEAHAFLSRRRMRFREVPQHIQSEYPYAPEVGRIRPGDHRPNLFPKPEMDNDPREPFLEPPEPAPTPPTRPMIPTDTPAA